MYSFNCLSFNHLYKISIWAMIAMCSIAIVLAIFYPQKQYVWWGITALVGMCQLVLYYHFLRDIIAGAYIGVLTGYFTVTYNLRFRSL